MNLFKLIRKELCRQEVIRFFLFVLLVVVGYGLDENFNLFIFLPIAFLVEGLLIIKYKSFFFYDAWSMYPVGDGAVSDETKLPQKHAVYLGWVFIFLGIVAISLFLIKGITLSNLLRN